MMRGYILFLSIFFGLTLNAFAEKSLGDIDQAAVHMFCDIYLAGPTQFTFKELEGDSRLLGADGGRPSESEIEVSGIYFETVSALRDEKIVLVPFIGKQSVPAYDGFIIKGTDAIANIQIKDFRSLDNFAIENIYDAALKATKFQDIKQWINAYNLFRKTGASTFSIKNSAWAKDFFRKAITYFGVGINARSTRLTRIIVRVRDPNFSSSNAAVQDLLSQLRATKSTVESLSFVHENQVIEFKIH